MKNQQQTGSAPHEVVDEKLKEIMSILTNMPTNQAKNVLQLALEYLDSYSIVTISS